MKLQTVIIQYTAVVLVGDERPKDEAFETVIEGIKAGTIEPSDRASLEPTHERDLPAAWVEQQPFVAASITDEQFAANACTAEGEQLNVVEIFDTLYKK